MGWLPPAMAFVVGLAVGSFLNVVIHRLPREESLLFPPSHCPSCKRRLGFWDLIPILSYLFLRGKCRYCGSKISARYPIVEGLAGVLFSLFTWRYFPSPVLLGHLAVVSALIAIAFIDLEHMLIPDVLMVVVAIAGVALDLGQIATGKKDMLTISLHKVGFPFMLAIPRSIAGGLLGLVLFYTIARASELAFKKEAMGEGDVLLAGALGAYLGPGYEFWAFFILAAVIGAAVGVAFAAVKGESLSTAIPFGPMMAASAIIVALFGKELVALLKIVYAL